MSRSRSEKFGVYERGRKLFLFVDLDLEGGIQMARSNEEDRPAKVRLSEAIRTRMKDYGENETTAELNVVRTDEGLRLWEDARAEEMVYPGIPVSR